MSKLEFRRFVDRARWQLRQAIKTGEVEVPELCPGCSIKTKLLAVHEDFKRPLDVRWSCAWCLWRDRERQAGHRVARRRARPAPRWYDRTHVRVGTRLPGRPPGSVYPKK